MEDDDTPELLKRAATEMLIRQWEENEMGRLFKENPLIFLSRTWGEYEPYLASS